jgi:Na+:H+ antiporter, NhaA family
MKAGAPDGSLPSEPSSARPISQIMTPFLRFAKLEASGAILLLGCTVIALTWANSPWEDLYHRIWQVPVGVGLGRYSMSESLSHWINDGLMAIFFFFVGLEIKREVLVGELSSFKQAAFPFGAALGGALVPALLFIVLNRGTEAQRGWGIPMATDIAFTLGTLALLGNRVPPALKVFVAALAIVDDMFAVLVIAVFFTSSISIGWLVASLLALGVSLVANRLGVRSPIVYATIGVFVWIAMLRSGVHATIAGILLALTIPARTYLSPSEFLKRTRPLLDRFQRTTQSDLDLLTSEEQQTVIHELERGCAAVQPPLHRMEQALQPWVSFVIMPVFALANAGVRIEGGFHALTKPVFLGVFLGLFFGKPLGIMACAFLFSKAGVAATPAGVSWRQIFGASWLCGIGFTMSLFVATLAFATGELLDLAKIGTLAASIAAGIAGSLVLLSIRNEAGVRGS